MTDKREMGQRHTAVLSGSERYLRALEGLLDHSSPVCPTLWNVPVIGSTIFAETSLPGALQIQIKVKKLWEIAHLISAPAAPAGKGWLAAPGYTDTTTLVSVRPSEVASGKHFALLDQTEHTS